MARCDHCGAARPWFECPRCGARVDGGLPEGHRTARALLRWLVGSGQIRVAKRVTPQALTRTIVSALDEAQGDVAALHEALFGLAEVEDLSVGVEELETFLREAEAREEPGLEVTLPTGEVVRAPAGAIQAALAPDGSALLVLFDHWLERRAVPSLELSQRIPLGAIDGYADRLSLSPSGRRAAVSYTSWRGKNGYLLLCDLSEGTVAADPSGHSHPAGPVVFGEDETVYAYASIDRGWPDAAAKERAAEKPWKVDFGSLSIGKIGAQSAGSWALWGEIPEPSAPTAGEEGVPVFREGRKIELRLPTGEVLSVDYASLFRVHAPNPKEFPEVVRHRVRPRARSAAELAIEQAAWRPAQPFAAQWLVPGERALVVTRGAAEVVDFADGGALARGALCLFEGWPTELVVREDGEVAAVVWHRERELASGVELLDLRGDAPLQLLGRGRRFVHWMKRMQPSLIGPLVFGPADQVAFTATMGGYWYDPSTDGVARRATCGLAYVQPIFAGTPKRLHLHPTTDLPPDHDKAEDPDRPRALRFTDTTSVEIELPHGELVARSWQLDAPPHEHDAPYPSTLEPLAPVAEAADLVSVTLAGVGALGRFRVPGARGSVTVTSARVHPSGGYVTLGFAEPLGDGRLCGVFSATTGQLVFERDGALAMDWAVGRPTRQAETSRDLVILTASHLIAWTLPAKELASQALDLPGPPRTLEVSPSARHALVTALDPGSSQLSLVVLSPRGGELFRFTPELLSEGVAASSFSPDGETWAGFVPALEPVIQEDGRVSVGEVWLVSLASRDLTRASLDLELLEAEALGGAPPRLTWSAEASVVVELSRHVQRTFERP